LQLKQLIKHEGKTMKAWTTQFVTSLWASGGFDAIAELHNRELEQLEGQMNNSSKESQLDNGENISADRATLSGGTGPDRQRRVHENPQSLLH
jgi:hypothetical protein